MNIDVLNSTSGSGPVPGATDGVNAPNLNEEGKPTIRAIKDSDQAWSVATYMVNQNRERNKRNDRIVAKYDGEAPYNQKELTERGEGWKANFSTGFLASIVDKVVPIFVDVIRTSRHLFQGKLKNAPDNYQAERKQDIYNTRTTNFVRHWKGWKAFIELLCQEDTLLGYVFAGWLDETSWKPRVFRQDDFFIPDATLQDVEKIQVVILKVDFLIHELAELIQDPEAAEARGWNIENCYEAINKAKPKVEGTTSADENIRKIRDQIRDGAVGISHSRGAKVIETYVVVAREYYGTASQYIVSYMGGKELRTAYDLYPTMSDAVAPITFEVGNGRIHGSKGLGRILYNMHVTIERTRMAAIDQTYLGGLMTVQRDSTKKQPLEVEIVPPLLMIDQEAKISETQINADVQPYFLLDGRIEDIAQQAAGAYIPQKIDENTGKERTATEANIDAGREQEVKQFVVAHFYDQFPAIMDAIQRRIYSKDNILAAKTYSDQGITQFVTRETKMMMERLGGDMTGIGVIEEHDGKGFDLTCVQLIFELVNEGLTLMDIWMMSREALTYLPPGNLPQQQAALMQFYQIFNGNPIFDQQELAEQVAISIVGFETADSLILTQQQKSTNDLEGGREQLKENTTMMTGVPVPVSPRDDHAAHAGPALQALTSTVQQVQTGMFNLIPLAQAIGMHLAQHAQAMEGNPHTKQQADQIQAQLKQMEVIINQAVEKQQSALQKGQPGKPNPMPGQGAIPPPPAPVTPPGSPQSPPPV